MPAITATSIRSAVDRLFVRFEWSIGVASRLALPLWFAIISANRLYVSAHNGWLAIDFRIYRHAAEVALQGGNAWATNIEGYRFAAPPPTLLPYLGLALIPEPLALGLSIVVLLSAAVAAVRFLRLPPWWLLFPPIVESLLSQNPDVAVIALLLLPSRVAGLAPVLKVYAAVPLLIQRRWAALAVALIAMSPAVLLLPTFITQAGEIIFVLQDQSAGLSAWGTWLVLPVVAALWILRGQGASWLVVPGLWPATQLHYACLALPAVASRPLVAAALSLAIPGIPPLTIIAWGTVVAIQRLRQRHSAPSAARADGSAS